MRLVIALFLVSQLAFPATYYVSNSGSDTNAGTSTGAAWADIPGTSACVSSCASTSLFTGDQVLLQAGGIWRGQTIIPPTTGLTYGSYGTGAAPVLNGANLIGSWTAYTAGTSYSVITSGTTATVPSGWNNSSNTIEVIGGGGAGYDGNASSNAGGGGGGGGGTAFFIGGFSVNGATGISANGGAGATTCSGLSPASGNGAAGGNGPSGTVLMAW